MIKTLNLYLKTLSFDSKLAMVWLGAFKMLKNAEYTGSIFVIIIKLMVLSANGLSQEYHIHLCERPNFGACVQIHNDGHCWYTQFKTAHKVLYKEMMAKEQLGLAFVVD